MGNCYMKIFNFGLNATEYS